MLDGIRIYSRDEIWRKILSDLGATVVDSPMITDVDFDALDISEMPLKPLELKATILRALDNSDIIRRVFGRDVSLSQTENKIIAFLYKSGGMTVAELRGALGYAADTTTHTVDTIIYTLRRDYGRDFIINDNGVYKLGDL